MSESLSEMVDILKRILWEEINKPVVFSVSWFSFSLSFIFIFILIQLFFIIHLSGCQGIMTQLKLFTVKICSAFDL